MVATLHEKRKKSGYESSKRKENVIGGLPNTHYYATTATGEVYLLNASAGEIFQKMLLMVHILTCFKTLKAPDSVLSGCCRL